MTLEISLDSYVAADGKKVKEIIRDGAGAARGGGQALAKMGRTGSIYAEVVTLFSDNTRNTPSQIRYLEAYETALGVFRASALELRKAMDILTLEQRLAIQTPAAESQKALPGTASENPLTREINDAIFLSNRYALFLAGQVGLALLNSQPATTAKKFSFGSDYDASKDRDLLTAQLAETARGDIAKIVADRKGRDETPGDEDIQYSLEAIFTTWVQQFDYHTFKDIATARGIADATLRFGNFSATSGVFKRKYDVVILDDKFMNVTRDDVIASGEFGQVLWGNFLKLAAYQPDRKINPFDPAGVVFTYGEPGCGKTFTAHAYIRSLADLCRTKGLPFWGLTHSTTDYASHYQNKTANELSALAERSRNSQGSWSCM